MCGSRQTHSPMIEQHACATRARRHATQGVPAERLPDAETRFPSFLENCLDHLIQDSCLLVKTGSKTCAVEATRKIVVRSNRDLNWPSLRFGKIAPFGGKTRRV